MAEGESPPRVIRSTPRLTRDEIENQAFAPAFRGVSEAAVRAFLRRIADEYDALRTRQDELFAEIDRLQAQLAQTPEPAPEQDLLSAVGEETARVLRSAKDAADEIRRGAEERAADLLRDAHDEARLLRDQTEQAATERTRAADDTAAEVLREAERLAGELQEGAEARIAQWEAQAEAEARSEVESARRRARELVAEAEATRDRILSELARRREALETQLEMLRGGRERLLDAYKVVKQTLDEATESLRGVDARPAVPEAKQPRVTSAALPTDHGALDAQERPAVTRPDGEPGSASPSVGVPDAEAVGAHGVDPIDDSIDDSTGENAVGEPAATELAAKAAGADSTPRVGSFALGELEVPVTESARPERARRLGPKPAAPIERYTVDQPSGVRLLGSNAEAAAHVAPPAEALPDERGADARPDPIDVDPEAAGEEGAAERHHDALETVDEIFARIRAERSAADESVAGAEPEGASGADDPAPAAAATPAGDAHGADVGEADAERTDAEVVDDPIAPRGGLPGPEEALRRRRDDALEPLLEELVRSVKRVVRDEQNVVLQAVREHRGVPSADAVLPSVADQNEAFAGATAEVLNEASVVGEAVAREFGISGGINGDGARRRARAEEMAAALARELMDPLRGKLGDALRDAAASNDESQVGERVRGRYREWKGQRIDAACRNALAAAFARGLFDAVPDGMPLRWVTTDATPCPDCADNSLEQTPRGRKFPTGHLMPPAHPGCHCLVLPVEVSADLEVV
ncbi:MAG TPA: DivIVA domain-containing protein [Acidimicrobiia bacterium]|nr:DivIVA domain-containing protein [Acidimicrobiia bacterium]